jgi:phospholipid/cholesterol/gamma-HCH transport system permease protein
MIKINIFQKIINLVQKIGSNTLSIFDVMGKFSIFVFNAIKYSILPRFYPSLILKQVIEIGFYSLPVIFMTAIFTGGVLALQTYAGASRFSAESTVPTVVVLSITRELGPVLAGLMVAGRVGAAMAAEIGTMRVTEQIEALKTLSANPFRYLIAPRIIASTIMLPVLVFICDIIGVMGGYLASVYSLGFSGGPYLNKTFQYLETEDVVSGLTKAAVFGFIIALMGCYHGYNSKGGAEGVGKATTNAVVTASILILIFNYLLTEIFFV